MPAVSDLSDGVRDIVISTLQGLFSHGPTPLEHTMDYLGDPGLIGPGSVSWRVLADSSVFLGGIRALVVQSAHPEVVAGVEDHSTYKSDPLGRLSRTAQYVTETTYGAMPEVDAAVQVVRRAHAPVKGTSERGLPYSAARPEMAAWVHNVLTESFLAGYQAFGPQKLTEAEADRFVSEQTKVGELLGADPLPRTAAELSSWIVNHPDRAATKHQATAIEFLRKPPLNAPVKLAYRVLFEAAVTTIDPAIRDQLGLTVKTGAENIGSKSISALRWALGSSPDWLAALVRCDEPIPEGAFRQPLRKHHVEALETQSGSLNR